MDPFDDPVVIGACAFTALMFLAAILGVIAELVNCCVLGRNCRLCKDKEINPHIAGIEELKRLRAEFDKLNQEKNKVFLQIEEAEQNLERQSRHPYRPA